jgi:hypothetical protein
LGNAFQGLIFNLGFDSRQFYRSPFGLLGQSANGHNISSFAIIGLTGGSGRKRV